MNNNFFGGIELPETLGEEELIRLFLQYYGGNFEARNTIIEHNIKLVIHVVNKFENVFHEKEELVQVGILGLIKSVDTYKLETKNAFSTYAVKCIQNQILCFLKLNKKHFRESVSFDQPISEDTSFTFADVYSDGSIDYFENLEKQEEVEFVRAFVSKLKDKEKMVMEIFFGFNNEPLSMQEIAPLINQTYQNVQRILKKNVKKMRLQMINKEFVVGDNLVKYKINLRGKVKKKRIS